MKFVESRSFWAVEKKNPRVCGVIEIRMKITSEEYHRFPPNLFYDTG